MVLLLRSAGGGYGSVHLVVVLDSAGGADAVVVPGVHFFFALVFCVVLPVLLALRLALALHLTGVMVRGSSGWRPLSGRGGAVWCLLSASVELEAENSVLPGRPVANCLSCSSLQA